jgi:ketosteroid isomerase-like protein
MISNQEIINNFFSAYIKRDLDEISKVMSEKVTWTFLGKHKLSGVKNGLDEVIAFFDLMGKIMSTSNPKVEKLVIGSNENYLMECQSII